MKRLTSIIIFCFLVGLLSIDTSGASICDSEETVIFFGNGVKSIKKEAYQAKEAVKKNLESELSPEDFELLAFDISYNRSNTLPLDLLESTLQLLTGNISKFWRYFWGLDPVPDWFADKLLLLSTALDYSALLTTDSLWQHVNRYQTAIAEGKKVLLVAHSQGNLFGNQAYNLLSASEKKSFGVVSVANIDNNVTGNYTAEAPYTTLSNDKVILALIAAQAALPTSPMLPNTVNLSATNNFWGHSFMESYMAEGSESNLQITNDIIAVLNSLATPQQIVESGVITVSLTWGPAPDVDLHVYEPNGKHVYWYNLQGLSGGLDRDDRSGWGPEHYRVPGCDTLEEGVYQVALDYFEGDNPETAIVQVDAGLLSQTFKIPMPSADYFGTQINPWLVANILAKNSENGGYEFEIFK